MGKCLLSALFFMFFISNVEASSQNTKVDAIVQHGAQRAKREPAARKKRRRRKAFKKRVTIDFEDELIEGSVTSPNIFHLFHKKQLNYGRLIKFRKNFLPEMRRTAREISK